MGRRGPDKVISRGPASTASLDEGLKTYDGGSTDLRDEGHLHCFTYRSLGRICIERAGSGSVEDRGYSQVIFST